MMAMLSEKAYVAGRYGVDSHFQAGIFELDGELFCERDGGRFGGVVAFMAPVSERSHSTLPSRFVYLT